MRRLLLISFSLLIAGCAALSGYQLDQIYGKANPARFDAAPAQSAQVEYWRDVKPITDSRCAVCHGCYDAPCQLQMGSYEGITRGGNKTKVYDGARLATAEPSRLFVDADSNAAWRDKGFHPVLNERDSGAEANLEAGVMARLLKLKGQYHFPENQPLPAERFDFSLDRDQQCPAIEAFDEFAQKHPDWGMPYGFPALSKKEEQTLLDWLKAGAPAAAAPPLKPAYQQRIDEWEAFMNGSTFKAQLAARYIYEHWFLGHFYFDDLSERQFFEWVRSKTPPGQPIQAIPSRRPFDDPGVPRVYYRLRPLQGALVAKTHMPYALNAARLARLQSWFMDADYPVKKLPSYEPGVAANPFVAFEQIPVEARYRLMLDEAQYTVMGFIKGPVCRGQVALNVITDYFWIGFMKPGIDNLDNHGDELAKALKNISLPINQTSIVHLLRWRQYSRQQTEYLRTKSEYFNEKFVGRNQLDLDILWDGDGTNPNAALTVFRHFDSATVAQGLVGEQPQTALIMGYPLLERIHYLLVAGFDVYGNVAHQLEARLYMDFLRMEGEMNVLSLLPKEVRNDVRDLWYRKAKDEVKAYLNGHKAFFYQDSGIAYKTENPWPEFLALWKQRIKPILSPRYELSASRLAGHHLQGIKDLAGLHGRPVSYLPETTFLTVLDGNAHEHHFTVLRNSAHSNISELFDEENRRLPDEDTLTVVPGFLGAYPNAFYRVAADEVPQLTEAIGKLKSETDYAALASQFAIRRTDPQFWQHSDTLHAAYHQTQPVEAALFDYNRFENR